MKTETKSRAGKALRLIGFVVLAGLLGGVAVLWLIATDDYVTLTLGEIKLSKEVIYALERQSANPSGGQEIAVNPPPLLWPRTVGKGVH